MIRKLIPVTVLVVLVCLAPLRAEAQAKFDYALGTGYLHTMGGIAGIWTDGLACDFTAAYRVSPVLGFEAGGLLGFTGMTNAMVNTVPVVDSYGNTSTESSTGGLYYAILLGPRLSLPIKAVSGSSCTLSLSAGGLYHGQIETGIGADGYISRWTTGFGGYAGAEARFFSGPDTSFWGIRLRYFYSYSNETDFYWYVSSPSYTDDQRIILSVEIGIE